MFSRHQAYLYSLAVFLVIAVWYRDSSNSLLLPRPSISWPYMSSLLSLIIFNGSFLPVSTSPPPFFFYPTSPALFPSLIFQSHFHDLNPKLWSHSLYLVLTSTASADPSPLPSKYTQSVTTFHHLHSYQIRRKRKPTEVILALGTGFPYAMNRHLSIPKKADTLNALKLGSEPFKGMLGKPFLGRWLAGCTILKPL